MADQVWGDIHLTVEDTGGVLVRALQLGQHRVEVALPRRLLIYNRHSAYRDPGQELLELEGAVSCRA